MIVFALIESLFTLQDASDVCHFRSAMGLLSWRLSKLYELVIVIHIPSYT